MRNLRLTSKDGMKTKKKSRKCLTGKKISLISILVVPTR
jgi:hypothetical protein